MGLPEYDPRNNVIEANIDRGMFVMDAISDEDLQEFHRHYAATQHLNLGNAPRAVEYQPEQDFGDGDDSDAAVFNWACK